MGPADLGHWPPTCQRLALGSATRATCEAANIHLTSPSASIERFLDRFATRINARLCFPAARFHAGSATKGPFQIEGRRECRARRARPQPRVQNKKAHELVTAGRRFVRHSPRNGFNGLLRALPGEPGFLATIPAQCEALSRVDASVGASGPHGFAVRRIAPSSEAPPASTASRPTLVTIRETPLDWGGTADSLLLFLPRRQAKFRKIRKM